MTWLLAQAVDADKLASANTQEVLAYVVSALVLAVLGLFGLLLKQYKEHKAELKDLVTTYETKLETKDSEKDTLHELLLQYAAKTNEVLSAMLESNQ